MAGVHVEAFNAEVAPSMVGQAQAGVDNLKNRPWKWGCGKIKTSTSSNDTAADENEYPRQF